MKKSFFLLLLTLIFGLSSCKKLVDVGLPENQLTTTDAFTDSASVTSVLAGMYSFMYNYRNVGGSPYKSFITTLSSLSADETYYFSTNTYPQFEKNAIPVADERNLQLWADSYKVIYMANNILENIGTLTNSSAAFRNQITGEAKFIRAFCLFYLTNMFGDVPLINTTDVTKTAVIARSSQTDVYKQIVDDLKEARNLLVSDYSYSNGERTRANHYVATAMLARVYLYMGLYSDAKTMSSEVIGNTADYTMETDLNRVFQKASKEAIFQFPTNVANATYVARDFLPGQSSNIPNFVIRDELINAFEPSDKRKDTWIGRVSYGGKVYSYPFKYHLNGSSSSQSGRSEYDVVLRLSEQYLIRAEANIYLNQLDEAKNDINELRDRAAVQSIIASNTQTMLQQLAHERQVELFCEWGHRWFDLKRTNKAASVIGAIKPTWKNTAVLFPIPQKAISSNTNLSQNPGYN